MKKPTPSYQRHRFPSEIISHAVWLYHRFCLSLREVEELLATRSISVTYETIRQWCQKFGPDYARKLKKRQGRLGDTWHIDKVFVTIQGQHQYLWRAVDQDGDVIDILVQRRRHQRAAERFIRHLLKGQGRAPRWLVSDKLRSYDAAHRTLMPTVPHLNHVYANTSMRKIDRKCLTNPLDNVNGPCSDFPLPLKHSGFSHCTDLHKICFVLAAPSCRRSTIGSYGLRRSKFGGKSCVQEL